MRVSVTRKSHFNAAHRLYNPKWDDQKNLEVFGKCSYPNYHGHNYYLRVSLTGDVNPETGYVFDLQKLSTLIREHIEDRFDHKNLNLDTVEFQKLIPTVENITVVIHNILRKQITEEYQLSVTVYETENNFATVSG